MPKFPTYDSTSNINIQTPPERHQAAAPFEDIQNMTNTITKLTQDWSDRNDVMQETKAKNSAEMSLYQQEIAAQNDPNPENAEMHIKAVNKISEDATKGISNQGVAQQTSLDIQHSAFLTSIKIQDMFKGKQILATKESEKQANVVAAQNIANPVSQAAALEDYDKRMSSIRTLRSRGIYGTDEEALAAEKELRMEIIKARVDGNKSTNPDDYKNISEMPRKEDSAGLDIKDSSELRKMVDSHIADNVKSNIENTYQNRVSVLSDIFNKDKGWKSNQQIKELSKGDSVLENSLIAVRDKRLSDPRGEYEPSSDENIEYSQAAQKALLSKNKDEAGKYLLDAIKEKGMTEERLSILINAVADRAKKLPTTGVNDIDPTQATIDAGTKSVAMTTKNDPTAMGDYLNAIHQGSSAAEAYKTATDAYKVKRNSSMVQHKIGDVITDNKTGNSGQVVKFDDDGVAILKVKKEKSSSEDDRFLAPEGSKYTPPGTRPRLENPIGEEISKVAKPIGEAIVSKFEHEAERATKWAKKLKQKSSDYYKKQAEKKSDE